jgi:hypothetical protein
MLRTARAPHLITTLENGRGKIEGWLGPPMT